MRFGRSILFLALTTILVLLLVEGSLRIYFALAPAPAGSPFIQDDDCGYRLRPGPFWEDERNPQDIVNSFGFRDREHSIEKPPDTFRIVGIGDSFVLGAVDIEDNFLRVAERRLQETPPADSLNVEVILMGLGGYGPRNQLGILRSTALTLDPDLVVLCFYVGNDITGISLRGEVLGGMLYFTTSSNPWHNLLRKSRLFVLIEKTLVTRWRSRNLDKEVIKPDPMQPGDRPRVGSGYRPTLYYLLIQKKRLPVYDRRPSETITRLWMKAEELLLEFDRTCHEAKVPWVLMLIPTEEQVDPDVRSAVLHALSLDANDFDFDLPQRRLASFAGNHGIPVLDLLPLFRAKDEGSLPLYIPNDTHWNLAGNQLAGESITAYVEQMVTSETAGRARPRTD